MEIDDQTFEAMVHDPLVDICKVILSGKYSLEGLDFLFDQVIKASGFHFSALSAGLLISTLITDFPEESRRGFYLWLDTKFTNQGLDLMLMVKRLNDINNINKDEGENEDKQIE